MRDRDGDRPSHWPEGIGAFFVVVWVIRMFARAIPKPAEPITLPGPPILLDDFIILTILVIATCLTYIRRQARRATAKEDR